MLFEALASTGTGSPRLASRPIKLYGERMCLSPVSPLSPRKPIAADSGIDSRSARMPKCVSNLTFMSRRQHQCKQERDDSAERRMPMQQRVLPLCPPARIATKRMNSSSLFPVPRNEPSRPMQRGGLPTKLLHGGNTHQNPRLIESPSQCQSQC